MKSFALLSIGAALLCAQTKSGEPAASQNKAQNQAQKQAQSQAKKPANHAVVTEPTSRAAAMREEAMPANAARPRASYAPRRNVHRSTTNPASPTLTSQEKKAAALPTIPEGAQEVGANLYRYTDAQGKTWLYRKTPFGVSKWEDKPDAQTGAGVATPTPAKVTDLGDKVQFERSTPFGVQKWTRKKSELTEEEKAAVDQARQPVGESKSAEPAKAAEKQ